MKKLLLFVLFLSGYFISYSQPLVTFDEVNYTGPALAAITDISGAGDNSGRLFICEKRGTIRILQNGDVLDSFFLDIRPLVINSGERGLLGMAFHPDFPTTPYVYVNYVRSDATRTNRIARFTLEAGDPNELDESSRLDILDILGNDGDNHKAGDMVFGPDGYLYFGTGDGGGGGDPSNNGQNTNVLLGKILRIDVNGSNGGTNYLIPPDNPYVGNPGRDEIFMIGARNPWRISFDRATQDLWIADVGQGIWEEVNMIPAGTGAGLNLGWDCREGAHTYSNPPSYCNGGNFTDPIFDYPHDCSQGPCPYGTGQSITGGFVYRGNNSANADFLGHYVAVDYVSENVFIIRQTGPNSFLFYGHPGANISGITTFGEDDNGEIYAGNLNGDLYLMSASGSLPLQWQELVATPINSGTKIEWTIYNPYDVDFFEVQRALHSSFSSFASLVNIKPVLDQFTYTYNDPFQQPQGAYYRVAAHMDDGSIEYSPTARLLPDPVSKPTLTYDLNTGLWRISLPSFWQDGELTLYDLHGRVVYENRISAESHIDLSRPVTPGVYFITIRGEEGTWSERIVR